MKLLAATAVSVGLAVSGSAVACSFAPGYEAAQPPLAVGTSVTPSVTPPALVIDSIQRASSGDNPGMCSDAGVLVLALDEPRSFEHSRFLFKVQRGEFPDTVIPEAYLAPIELPSGQLGFRFVWLDWPAGARGVEPIDVDLAVTRVLANGAESIATIVSIKDPG